MLQLEQNVMDIVEEDPGSSARKVGHTLNVSPLDSFKILQDTSLSILLGTTTC